MYIHVFSCQTNYSYSFIQMMERNVDISQHVFVFGVGKDAPQQFPYSPQVQSRVLSMKKPVQFIRFLRTVNDFKWIYIHLLSYDPTLFYWASRKKLLAKATWIVWGTDIYSYYKQDRSLKNRMYEWARRKIIREFTEIAGFVEEDFQLIKKLYTTNAGYIPVLYPIPVNLNHLKSVTRKAHDVVNVLIGNSGDSSNFHEEMLNALSKYKDENICVYCPLSYGGTQVYKDAVIRKGTEIFGAKFKPILRMMNAHEYAAFLSEIDVALMNHKRQQGLGNILALLFLGSKVYLRNDITSYQFLNRKDCEVFDIQTVELVEFVEFTKPVSDAVKLSTLVEDIVSEKNYLSLWLELFKRHS